VDRPVNAAVLANTFRHKRVCSIFRERDWEVFLW